MCPVGNYSPYKPSLQQHSSYFCPFSLSLHLPLYLPDLLSNCGHFLSSFWLQLSRLPKSVKSYQEFQYSNYLHSCCPSFYIQSQPVSISNLTSNPTFLTMGRIFLPCLLYGKISHCYFKSYSIPLRAGHCSRNQRKQMKPFHGATTDNQVQLFHLINTGLPQPPLSSPANFVLLFCSHLFSSKPECYSSNFMLFQPQAFADSYHWVPLPPILSTEGNSTTSLRPTSAASFLWPAKSLRHLMPQDVYPETKLNISPALQVSDCFATKSSYVVISLCKPRNWKTEASVCEVHSQKTTSIPIWPALRNKRQHSNSSYASV